MKQKNKIKLMACVLVFISNFAWSQEITVNKENCYVISKIIIGTGGSPNEIIGIGGSSNEIIGIGGITAYCAKEIIGHGG